MAEKFTSVHTVFNKVYINIDLEPNMEIFKKHNVHIQTWAPLLGITTLNAINEKSTIFDQFCSNFQGLPASWMGQPLKV